LKNRKSKIENHFNVLFTCIGRRVSLLESFRRAAKQLKINASLLGTDTTELSPALQLCDRRFGVKPTTHTGYIKQILSIVKANKVKLLVPTVDLDLKLLAQNKPKFTTMGCRVLVSDPEVIDICQDKRKTYKFLLKNNFDTPATVSIRTALKNSKSDTKFPLFLKPWDGYAGRGNAVVNNRKELLFYTKRIPNAICQELVEGTEYTCDVYVDFGMKIRCVVPRKRIEVRAGEVRQDQIHRDKSAIRGRRAAFNQSRRQLPEMDIAGADRQKTEYPSGRHQGRPDYAPLRQRSLAVKIQSLIACGKVCHSNKNHFS